MTRKKKQRTRVVHDGSDDLVRAKHGLVRDSVTEMLKTIPFSQMLGRNVETIRVGLEVPYETDNHDRGRGVVLFIGSEDECEEKLRSLENKEGNEEALGSTTTATNPMINGSGVLASTDSGVVATTIVDEANKKQEDATTVKDLTNTDGNASDENNKDDVTTNNKESNVVVVPKNSCSSNTANVMSNDTVTLTIEKNIVALVAEAQNSRPRISNDDGKSDTAATNNNENERASRSSISIGNQSSDVVCDSDTNTQSVIAELLREHQTPTSNSIIRMSAMLDRTNNLVDVPCAEATLTESVHQNVLSAKRPKPTSAVPNNRKRAKISTNNDTFSHEECVALKTENENLKREIQELKATMLPMPNPSTVDYLAAVLHICNGRNRNRHEDDEQVQELSSTLGLSKDELEQSIDEKSIRKTCRNVLRKVFKAELADPEISYSQVLLNEEVMSAIRRFGRLKHPIEATKFSNGDLNNALGNDFYQRDRVSKR